MRPPEFWGRRDGGLAARLLAPVSGIWTAVGRRRQATASPFRAPVPVICVGNVVVGGAGKTPTALALAERLVALGRHPVFLTRGHGGRLPGPVIVDPAVHAADEVGDEPLLLARAAPTIVARDRAAGARLATTRGDVIVMDDGFQNPSLAKDLSLLVVDREAGIGNGRVLPAGPLREPVSDALARAHALVAIGPGPLPFATSLPVLGARIAPVNGGEFAGQRVVAFAGIGRPDKFFASLRAVGAELAGMHAFGDHQRYTPDELMRLVEAASGAGALLVTTAKDAARLPAEARPMVSVLEVRLVFDDPQAVDALLARALEPRAA
jgi:tetraacyldisaccharide 4'-kinase